MRFRLKALRRQLCVSGLLLAVCAGCRSATHEPSNTLAAIHLFRPATIGLCEDYPKDSRTLANARRDLALLKTNHIHVLRISFSWLDMEPERGTFDWTFWDDFVRMAVDDYGVRLIPYICYTPRWASGSTNEDYWQQPPADNASFAEFVKQIVARYQTRIHSWEIWNEPDNSYYWRGSAEQFAALLAAGARAVKETDPHANVVMGGLAWNLDFLQTVISDRAAMANVDVINLHNYYETWASDPLERIPDYVGRASDLLHEHGARQPIWLAEVGYSSFRHGAEVSGQYRAYFRDEHTPQAQAAALFRVLTLALSCTNISLTTWYRIHDLPAKEEVIGDANNRHLGILDQDNRAKPALRALQFFMNLFRDETEVQRDAALRDSDGTYRCIDNVVTVEKTIAAPVEVHAFQKPDGTIFVMGWLKTYVVGTRTKAASGDIPDKRDARIRLQLPMASGRIGLIFDELGREQGRIRLAPSGKAAREAELRLRDGQVTVLEVPSRLEH